MFPCVSSRELGNMTCKLGAEYRHTARNYHYDDRS